MVCRSFRWLVSAAAALQFAGAAFAPPVNASALPTPLEALDYARLPTASENHEFLRRLAASHPRAAVRVIGHSAGGREVLALVITADGQSRPQSSSSKLTFLLTGSQHGQEPSGAEALLMIARDLLGGRLDHYLAQMDLVMIPMLNPDGRDLNRRGNAAGGNTNIDFVALQQPETQALVKTLIQFSPDVVLDVHESAAFKKKTLAAQGYLVDFEAQYDVANNPNVDPRIRELSSDTLLPSLIAAARKRGLDTRHYIGEITNVDQPATHAGLSIRNFRNYAAIRGAVSVLLETRLDPPGQYETPRNIKVRVHRQYLAIDVVLDRAIALHGRIRTAVAAARTTHVRRTVSFDWRYESDRRRPTIMLPLRRLATNERVEREFEYRSRIVASSLANLPRAYVVRDPQQEISTLLERHGIAYRTVVSVQRSAHSVRLAGDTDNTRAVDPVSAARIAPGDLWVDAQQSGGLLAPLLLDPRSTNTLFRQRPYSALTPPSENGAVLRID